MDGVKITKKGLKDFIKFMVDTNDRWALRALVVIYNEQSDDEKRFGVANRDNGRGFGKVDAGKMCPIAQRYIRYKRLNPYDMIKVHKVMRRYSRQLFDLSNMEILERHYRKYLINAERIVEEI